MSQSDGFQRAVGNQAMTSSYIERALVQKKSVVGPENDAFEQEADRAADRVVSMSLAAAGSGIRNSESGVQVRRKAQMGSGIRPENAGPGISQFARGGIPLSHAERTFFEPRFDRDFSAVRIHSGDNAARAARDLRARAFTMGQNIVFAQGEYGAASSDGKRLVAHELAHTIQQQSMAGAGASTIFRQPNDEAEEPSGLPAPIAVPGTDLTLLPGSIAPFLGNERLLLPSSLRLRHFPLTGTGPQFTLSLSQRRLMGMLLGNIDLYSWTRPGTPTDLSIDPSTQARISLVDPSIHYDTTSGVLRGRATLSVGTDYPAILKAPTELDVEFSSSSLGQFRGSIGLGPLEARFSLQLHYDTSRLEDAVAPVFAPPGGFRGFELSVLTILRSVVPGFNSRSLPRALRSIWQALIAGEIDGSEFASRTIGLLGRSIPRGADLAGLRESLSRLANELSHPGFSTSGSLRLFGLPLTGFIASAPTTVPFDRPLAGAPTAFPFSSFAGGIVLAPPGSITDVAVPALGLSGSSFGDTSGSSFTAAFLPSISTDAISRGDPAVNQFPVYAFVELSHVRRITDGLDLGVRVTAQLSTPELFGPRNVELDPAAALTRSVQDFQDAQRGPAALSTPNLGLTIFGEFGNF